jgi:hypothetical protein
MALRVSFSRLHYIKLGRTLEVHDVSGIERPRTAGALLASPDMGVSRLVFHRGVDGVGAHRAVDFRGACGGGLCIGQLGVGHVLSPPSPISTHLEAKKYRVFSDHCIPSVLP